MTMANVPQISGKTSSQIAIDDIHGISINQGTNAPIANDWMSPRPKIAAITKGVGRTHVTVTNSSEPMKSRKEEAKLMTIAATTTAISSHAKLNWNRGRGNQRRVGWLGGGSKLGMIHSAAGEFPRTTQPDHTIPAVVSPNKVWRSQPLCAGWAGSRRRQCLSGAGDEFLGRFAWLEHGDGVAKSDLQFAIDERQQAIRRGGMHALGDEAGFGLRAAGEHGDEFTVFERNEDVHFA